MKSIADINAIREKMQSQIILRNNPKENETKIVVGMATCGIAAGAKDIFNTLVDEVAAKNISNVKVTRGGCLGTCAQEPIVEVLVPGQEKVTYVNVDAEQVKNIIAKYIVDNSITNE